jgi:RsiW-degrading membrane proteinase PrsW (M82 family)
VRWIVAAALPALLCAVLAYRTTKREPAWLVLVTFLLGAAAGLLAHYATHRPAVLTGLHLRVATGADENGVLVFLFLVVVPIQEAGKVAAAWPAFLSKHIDESFDGVVYAAASSLGFAAAESASVLRAHPMGAIWPARAFLALLAHVFFACLWGYALGRARHFKTRLPVFPAAFFTAIVGRALYTYFVYGRGPGALLAVSPLLLAMGVVAWVLGRDLRDRYERTAGRPPPPLRRPSRHSVVGDAPSLAAVRAALTRAEEPIQVWWVLFGALVTIGAMLAGLAGGVLAAHLLRIDLSTVDEHDLRAAAPAMLLGAGVLASFPTSGWLIARAADVPTLLEPALAAVLALVITLVSVGLAAPFAVVFGLALSPIAWVLSCAGAWVGRQA